MAAKKAAAPKVDPEPEVKAEEPESDQSDRTGDPFAPGGGGNH